MKSLVRTTALYAFALYILPTILPGVRISGGLPTYLLAGFILTVMFLVLKPVLNIFALPLNLVTFGLFSFFINVIILYILTVLIPQITISAFVFPGFSFLGFVVPKLALNTFFAYIAASFVVSLIVSFIKWVAI